MKLIGNRLAAHGRSSDRSCERFSLVCSFCPPAAGRPSSLLRTSSIPTPRRRKRPQRRPATRTGNLDRRLAQTRGRLAWTRPRDTTAGRSGQSPAWTQAPRVAMRAVPASNVPSGWALVEVSFQGVGCDGAYQGGTSTLSTDPDGGMVVYTCVPLSAPACATGVCAPAVGTGLRLCVSQANDVACPNGYTERSVEYAAGSVATTLCCL